MGLAGGACLGNEIEHGAVVGRCQEITDYIDMKYEDLKKGE